MKKYKMNKEMILEVENGWFYISIYRDVKITHSTKDLSKDSIFNAINGLKSDAEKLGYSLTEDEKTRINNYIQSL